MFQSLKTKQTKKSGKKKKKLVKYSIWKLIDKGSSTENEREKKKRKKNLYSASMTNFSQHGRTFFFFIKIVTKQKK